MHTCHRRQVISIRRHDSDRVTYMFTESIGASAPIFLTDSLSTLKPSVAQSSAYQGFMAADLQKALPPIGIAFLIARIAILSSSVCFAEVGENQSW